MKVSGETFSFYHIRKRAEEVRYQKYPNFQAKRTAARQYSGELYTKKHRKTNLKIKTISRMIRLSETESTQSETNE